MCVNYKLCVKLHKGPSAFNMEKFHSLQKFYTHALTGVTDNYQVWTSITSVLVKHCTVIELKLSICKSYKCDHQLVPFAFSHCIGLPYWT